MLILSLLQGLAFGDRVELPYLWDFTVHIRFLICVPLLIIAEVVLDARTRAVVKHFIASGIIQEKNHGDFESVVRRAVRLRDSLLAHDRYRVGDC